MSYEFQSVLHSNTKTMCDAIAYEWMTAGGANHPETVDKLLVGETAKSMSDECIEGWGLNAEWLTERDTTASEIEAAFERFIATRPDRDNG